MGIDINGYALANASGLKFGASNTKVIAANYGISDPNLPGMTGAAMLGSSVWSVYPYPVSSVTLNNGSPWSTGTYRFTAPVAGIYYVSWGTIVGDGAGTQAAAYMAIIVNGANLYWTYKDTLSLWEMTHLEGMFKLAAGDWVAFAANKAPGPVSGIPTSGAHQGNNNIVSIWLIG